MNHFDIGTAQPARPRLLDSTASIIRHLIHLPNRALSAAEVRVALPRGGVGVDSVAPKMHPIVDAIAEHTADPVHVAADLISRAEHDEMADSAFVTDRAQLADAADRELVNQLQTTVYRERVTAALTGKQSAIVLVDDLDVRVRVNAYAAELLEIQTTNAHRFASWIRSADAVFVDVWSPVSPGDYCAGSNQVLHSSGLMVQTFLKGIHVVDYDVAALKDVSANAIMLPQNESLSAHGEPARHRLERMSRSREEQKIRPARRSVSLADLPLRQDLRGRSPYDTVAERPRPTQQQREVSGITHLSGLPDRQDRHDFRVGTLWPADDPNDLLSQPSSVKSGDETPTPSSSAPARGARSPR